jgi:hypothetical protein
MAQKFTVPVTIKNLSSAGSDGLTVFLDQESFARLKVEAGGRFTWGSGAGAGDTNLYRDAESVLKTDDTFKAAGLYVAGTQIDTVGATTGEALVFNGTKFVSASVAGGGGTGNASLTVSDTAPEDPILGDLWFNSTDLEIYVYYSSAWIQVTDSSSGVQELYELVDVLIEDPVYGETLTYNGTEWENGPAGSALKLENARTISLSGDVSGSVMFDGSASVSIPTTIQPNSVALGTDTTGNYMSDLTQGTGVTITHTPSEGSNATIAIGQAVATSSSVTFAAVTAPVIGNASTATTLQTARAITLGGDLSGSASFNGASDITINASVINSGVSLDEISDVVITSPLNHQSLTYNGTNWVNEYAPTVTYARNAEANALSVGEVVYLFGAAGDRASVKRASNSSEATSSKTVGVVAIGGAAGSDVAVTTLGYVSGLSLGSYAAGDVLWLGSTAGTFTTTKPTAPNHLVFIGVVTRANNGNGIMYVKCQNGYELEELHNVKLNGTTDGQFLRYNSASTVWIADEINLGTDTVGDYMSGVSASTGITVSHTPGEGSTATISLTGGPAFSAYPGTSQTISSGGTLVKVLFETEEFDTGSCFSSSRFTPTVAGYYQINSTVRFDGGGPGTGECMIVIFKNGGEAKRGWNSSGTSFANDFFSMSVSGLIYCNGTTDYIEIYAQQVSGGNRTTSPYFNISYFQGYLARYA